MSNAKHIWITWERQTRNRSMAKALHADYIEYTYKKGPFRYIVLSIKTLFFLISRRPEIIYFQNPSIVLGLVCTLYGFIFRRAKLVGDYHNCALDELSRLYSVNKFIARNCSLIIVTNPSLEEIVKRMGGTAISFPDPLPDVESDANEYLQEAKDIVFVTSWASDEPINEVLNAFIDSELHNDGVSLLMTGKPKFDKLENPKSYYEQRGIKFLGFVDEASYWATLKIAYFVIDLTLRDNCMVCGAYEALAVNRVLLLSNNQASVDYFGENVVYTTNTKDDISNKLSFINSRIEVLNSLVESTVNSVLEKQKDNVVKIMHLLKINN